MPSQVSEVRQEFPTIKLVYKSMNPGHPNCHNATGPIDFFDPVRNDTGDNYSWNMHPAFDNYSRQRALQLNMTLIEMAPLYLRPDGYSDCLHMCLPGPLDLFSILLLTMLRTGEL